jgi:transcriptional regulator with XRE-family HTH domain
MHQQMGRSVGAKLKEARLAKKYTQSQLAGNDFSVSYISAIERGQIHPSLRALEIFAMRLGLSSKDLLIPQSPEGSATTAIGRSTNSTDEFDWRILTARVMIEQGSYQTSILQLQELLSLKLAGEQEILVRYLLALAFSKCGLWQESENALSPALLLAKGKHNYLYARLLLLQSMTHASLQDHGQGLALYQNNREQLESLQSQDAFYRSEVYAQLGLHFLRLDRATEAQDMLVQALQATEALTGTERIEAYLQGSQQLVESGDYTEATLYLYKCLHLLGTLEDRQRRSELFHALGRAMLEGKREETRAYLEQALEQATTVQDTQSEASAHIHLAAWLLEHDEAAEARKHAQQARTLLSSTEDSLIAADAQLVSGKVDYAQKRYKAGDAYIEAGLAMLERLNLREELSDNAAQYAQLLEQHGDVHRAVTYWKKAFDSRKRQFNLGGE